MQDFSGRTAVVTGAASGIGKALADGFADRGMNVVLADIEQDALDAATADVGSRGVETLAVRCDVSDGDRVDQLAAATRERFGDVHVLCNNAGVGGGGLVSELRTEDWQWVLGVNLWGVIHGLRAFLGDMIAHGQPAHVVNTASMAGLIAGPFMAPYNASKFAVVAITESLHAELTMTQSNVKASVLCPGWVSTRIHEASRNRPAHLGEGRLPEGRADFAKFLSENGLPPAEVAAQVLDAIEHERFYVLTHPDMLGAVEERMRAIVEGREPRRPTLPA